MTKWKYSRKEIGEKLGIVEDRKRGVITYPGDIPGLKVAELLFWIVKAPTKYGKKVKKTGLPKLPTKIKDEHFVDFNQELISTLSIEDKAINKLIDWATAVTSLLKNK